MKYKLEIKPAAMKDGQKYRIIELTDLTLHGNNDRPTKNMSKKLDEGMKTKAVTRIHAQFNENQPEGFPKFNLDFLLNDPEFIEMVRKEEAKGYKVLISIPDRGVPVYIDKGVNEFTEGVKGKRIARKLYKDKDSK